MAFRRPLKGTLCIIHENKRYVVTFPTVFFYFLFLSKSLVIVSRGTLCKSCSASYNIIAINIARTIIFIYIEDTKNQLFSVKELVNSFLSLSNDEIVYFIPRKCFFVSLKKITNRSSYLLNKPFKLNSLDAIFCLR